MKKDPGGEVAGLRRTMRDLVALSALPAVWTGYPSDRIAESLAEVVVRTLSLDLVYVRFPRRDRMGETEAVRCHDQSDESGGARDAQAVGRALAPWLGDPFSPTAVIPHPLAAGTLRITITRFGFGGDAGIVVAGSSRANFPTEQEHLLLSVGANQAAIAIQRRREAEARLGLLEREQAAHREAQMEVAERRRAEESERAARTQAERASRLRDDFLATVSHELRNPLNSVLGWAQVLRRTALDEKTRVQALDAIERGTRAQMRLIEDLLDVSRIISGKLRLEVQTVDLIPLIQAAIEAVQPAAEARDIRIEGVMDPLGGPIKGDPARLQQVFWNLLSNAVKFTPKGGKVQVHLERIDSRVEVSVSDTGRGIAPEFLPHVFDRFSQADSSTTRRHGGLGLGLAVVKHLVELHGGRVAARSPGENRGATFSVHLPIAIIHQDAHGREHLAPGAGSSDAGIQVSLKNVRVLVVDDDRDACEMLVRVLGECEAVVDMATSASQALHLMSADHDIVVSDIGMPEMDGYELIRRLRTRGHTVPAVAVTAFARSEDRIRALQAGYNMHVAKPLEPRELIAVIAALVRRDRPD